MNELKSRSRRHSIAAIAALLVTVIAAGLLMFQRQYIHDQLIVWQYEPTARIAAMAERTTMTDRGRFYFYASRPVVENNRAFNDSCSRLEPQTAILGCYRDGQIFMYNVNDPRLDGIVEVTAAHELLHAVYVRLSSAERDRIDTLLDAQYATLKNDRKFAERMAFYDRTEPGERHNELYAIVGTEVAALDPQLEATYAMYFKNRQSIVALHASYEGVFTKLTAQADTLSQELDVLSGVIRTDTDRYNSEVKALNEAIEVFNQRAGSDGFQSQSQFEAERGSLVARAETLETLRGSINKNIERYEVLRTELEAVSSQSRALNQSIDSRLAPTPSV